MNEQSDNSGQLPQAEAGSGGDSLDARAVYALATSWRRQASSQKSGRSTLIRCAEELEAALAARQPAGQARVEELRDALGKVRLRCMFIGWPAESMWEATPGNWIPDWRYELQLMEHVLHGSEIRTPEKPTDTVPRNQLPRLVANEPVAKVRQDGGNGPVVWYYPHTFYGTKIPDGADLFLGPPAPAAVPAETFQAGVSKWMGECFLPSLYSNMTERGDRLLEEVLELLQSHGYDRTRVATLVDYVYGRPVGEPAQEVGGVMVTLAGYCWVAGLDMHAEGARELERITQPEVMAKIRRKQEAKNALNFDTPLPGQATAPQPAAATGVPELFVQWLEREMPPGTIIGKPAWWAPKLARALRSAERGVLGGCNG
ncbi:hypothetical protein QSH46_013295 [Xanthomonas arboricola pv. juglandis]|uniref:Uncharacterized protein n=1 Tax=Xanthomonas campestris pv. juglandis TaxID=195709 RepID=A0A7U7HM21_XANCJ|nr:hypothetical protein [Xanthomonas arboricola]MDN0220808.1 hypothetical protein [Xanthomonas arboricola pv. juglandis]MDN0225039.1 hypothetical protein [Xanthomonas arboricola pv. juglandis]MDN0229253.1 hypothetical protein [Xanthomonas arboricola pv. juglandis]MDN0233717.1 hypothetical protein [Xanthomonas arboricola pv. juglandis]MDN0237977.1 hypothetical protein [Xanthomonas arboricola pv. juglandis]